MTIPEPMVCYDFGVIRDRLVKKFNMRARTAWGTKTPEYDKMDLSQHYFGIAIHHYGNRPAGARGIEAKHMGANGWSDVGYHFMIGLDGTHYEGRHIRYKGAHVLNRNTGVIGIQVMGDFQHQWWDFDDTLTGKHKAWVKELVKGLQATFTITTLGGHSEWTPGHSVCPGNALLPWVKTLRAQTGLAAP